MDLFLQKGPDDGSVKPKHVAWNVFFNNKVGCVRTDKICTLYMKHVALNVIIHNKIVVFD